MTAHSWTRVGWLMPRSRGLLFVYYALPCAAGLVALFHPGSGAVAGVVTISALAVFWAVFYALGGALCALGVLLKAMWGEVFGLPLVVSASAIYAVTLLLSYPERGGPALVVGLLLTSQALGMLDRWLGLMALLKRAREVGVG